MSNNSIKQIKTKLPFPPFAANAFLFKTRTGAYLFDTGLKNHDNIKSIIEEITSFGGIDAIILSHGHLDHAGAASSVSREFDVPVYVSFDEKDRISNDFNARVERRIKKILKILTYFGFDKETTEREYDKISYYKNLMDPIEFFFNIKSLNDPEINLLELPGHSMGSAGLYIKETGCLLSGDALLKDGISPFFDAEAIQDSLLIYLESLDKISAIKPKIIFPGHGEPFEDADETITKHKQYVEETRGKIMGLIENKQTFSDIYKALFPPKYNALIALSEIIFALENAQIPILQSLTDLLSE